LAGQFGDGVFQVSLAGAVLFNPERQAHAADVAAGFAVVLLPYSLVGPFAGVLLDRWWRQRVLVIANLLRAVLVLGVAAEVALGVNGEPFYVSALVVVSINRFVLSTLSASLPHVVEPPELVTANALSTTAGGVAATLGGGFAIAVRGLVGDTNVGYGIIGALALLPYLASALTARGFGRPALGPDDVQRGQRETARARPVWSPAPATWPSYARCSTRWPSSVFTGSATASRRSARCCSTATTCPTRGSSAPASPAWGRSWSAWRSAPCWPR
jgi:MFS family permease